MNKKHNILIITIFVTALFALSIFSFIDKDKKISTEENRTLKQRPGFSFASLIDGSFAKDFEEYFSDQFPFRKLFIKMNFKINSLMKVKNKEGITIIEGGPGGDIGQNVGTPPPVMNTPVISVTPNPTSSGTSGPTAEPIPTVAVVTPDPKLIADKKLLALNDRILEVFWYSKDVAGNYINAVNRLSESLPGVTVYSMITPNAVEFYWPKTVTRIGQYQKEAIDYVYGKLNPDVKRIDVYNTINKHLDEYVFFRTDHHWTQRGAYYAYTKFSESAGFTANALTSYNTEKITGFLGTYYKYTKEDERYKNNPDYVEVFFPKANNNGNIYYNTSMSNPIPIKAVRTSKEMASQPAKYMTFINGDNPLSCFNTGVKNGKKIIVFKDSYGNAFVPFLLSHYEEVYVVDDRTDEYLSNITQFIKDKGIQEVLFANYINAVGASDVFVQLLKML